MYLARVFLLALCEVLFAMAFDAQAQSSFGSTGGSFVAKRTVTTTSYGSTGGSFSGASAGGTYVARRPTQVLSRLRARLDARPERSVLKASKFITRREATAEPVWAHAYHCPQCGFGFDDPEALRNFLESSTPVGNKE